MDQRKFRELLKEHEFSPLKTVRHGEIWGDSYGKTILLAREHAGRNAKNFLCQLKRAIKDRPLPEITVIKPGTPILRVPQEDLSPAASLETTSEQQPQFKPNEEPTMKLSPKSKQERKRRGLQIIKQLQSGEFPLLTYDDLMSVLKSLEYKNCFQKFTQIAKKVTSIKDGGITLYESKEMLPLIADRMGKAAPAAATSEKKQKQIKIKLPQYAQSLYEQIALAEQKSVEEVFARVLTDRAKAALQELAKNF